MTPLSDSARLSRGATLLLVGLLTALVLATAVFGGGGEAEVRPAYALDSAQPDGLLALSRWLTGLGYDAAPQTTAAPPAAADGLLFVWPGGRPFTDTEAAALDAWVRRGGTLALIGPTWNERRLAARFGVRLGQAPGLAGAVDVARGDPPRLRAHQPLVPDGPIDYGAALDVAPLDLTAAPNAVAVIAGPSGPTVAVQALGRGQVWHFAPRHDFTNERLADARQGGGAGDAGDGGGGDRALLIPLLRHVPAKGVVRFDAYHLDVPAPGAPASDGRGPATLREWLWATGPGRAILWLIALAFAALVLAGLRLGPPLPPSIAEQRRTEAEFVTAMAGLHRRAGDRALVADHVRARLLTAARRALSLPPSASAGDVDAALAAVSAVSAAGTMPTGVAPGLDAATAARYRAALAGLAAVGDEAALLRWAVEAEAVMRGGGRGGGP
ncbi:MAG: DUF4350 domain-containing protein [Ardenticatenales bacterium]